MWGEPAKNGKENFWFWFRRFIPPERTYIYILALWRYFVRPFFRHSRRCEALPYPRLVVILASAHTSQTPRIGRSHSLTMPARCCSCSLCDFDGVRGSSKKADCAKLTNGTSKSYCACPNPPVRAQAELPYMITGTNSFGKIITSLPILDSYALC